MAAIVGDLRPLLLAAAGLLLVAAGASAQAYWQPQPAPLVTAEREQWFQLGQPITFEGSYYYPAGARVYFDGNVMVRTGAYRGVPLYADTTIEPYSRVFVPLPGGLMQPYERRRTGDLAGTTGSRAPSFPVTIAGERSAHPLAAPSVGAAPAPPVFSQPADLEFQARVADEASSSRDEREHASAAPSGEAAATAGGANASAAPASGTGEHPVSASLPPRDVVAAGRTPKGLNEIYVTYEGYRWRSAGKAVRFDQDRYEVVGQYRGYPVYAARATGNRDVIYVPSRSGLIAPYERAGAPPLY